MTDIRKDVAEVLALLSPGAMRLDCAGAGTGGRLTGADVAHALGTINDPLGREVLILRGNPDAALHSEQQLVDLLYQHVIAEAEARVHDAIRARMRNRAEPRQTFPWPQLEGARCPRYYRLAKVCRAELAARERSSGRSLAAQMLAPDGSIGIDEKAWRQSWAAPFEWLVHQATEHESEAKRQLAYALSNAEARQVA